MSPTRRRFPWFLAGVGATLTAEFLLLLVGVVVAVLQHDASKTTMAEPVALRFDEHPAWPVGTCLAADDPVPCARDHDAEVLAILDPGREDDERRRRWVANSACAREVAVVAAEVDAPLLTHASLYPSNDLQGEDSRVLCLLVSAHGATTTGSWTAGDLDGPHPPTPFE